VALVAARVIVAVYSVSIERAADVVKVAILFVAFMATVPGTLVPVAFSLSVNVLSAPGVAELIVRGSIARLKVAVINLPLLRTPVVLVVTNWLPLMGFDEVTVGIVGPVTVHKAPGMIPGVGVTVGVTVGVPVGVTGSSQCPPPPPPHPGRIIIKTLRININTR
jgi:hypothetical protein